MKSNIIVMLLLMLLQNQVNTLNILAIFPYYGKSHFMTFKMYLKELTNRGHNVTVVSYFSEKNPLQKNPNYHDINLGEAMSLEDEVPVQKSYLTIFITGHLLMNFADDNCKVLVANQQVQQLVKDKQKFDLMVTEQFNSDCSLGIAHKLGVPVLGMSSHFWMPFQCKRYGIPNNPAYTPFHFLSGGTKPSLYQRLERVVFDLYFRTYYTYQQWKDQNTLAQVFNDIPPLEDLAREIKFLLVYQHFTLTGNRLLPANVIEVGGYHVTKGQPLTGDLKKFVEEAEYGVVYLSFGSMIKISSFSEEKKQALFNAFKEFPQRFILKCNDNSLNTDNNKFYISNWLPQVDILAHPKTLAFIGHGGMGGITEGVHYGVPMIVMAVFGDQLTNAAVIEEAGFGIDLDINSFDKESLVAALKKVLSPEFRAKAKEISKAWHDRPMSPMDTAVYWTEFAARNSNFTYRAAAADTPLYLHLNLDIAAVFITISLVTLLIMKTLIYFLCCRSDKSPKRKETKSKGKKRSKYD